MIIKKLAAPLINEKILSQAEHCSIATTAISEPAFEFMRARLPLKCKIEIVTGLDGPTSPEVLRRIWRHYHDRMWLKVYTKNVFHANVYIFDLPYRKAVAFIGSGPLTLEGIKDGEEIFTRISDPKEIEALTSWFTGYYEFSEPLTEGIIREYEYIYPAIRQREIASREEKEQALALTTRGFNWDTIKFKHQYFKKEDYLTFGNDRAALHTEAVRAERAAVRDKLLQLHASINAHLESLALHAHADGSARISDSDPANHSSGKVRSMWIAYGRSAAAMTKYRTDAKPDDFMSLQIAVQQKDVAIRLQVGNPNGNREDREHLKKQMEQADYRNAFFKLVQALGPGYSIGIAGEKKPADSFQTEDMLWEFVKQDDWRYYTFTIGKNYAPGDPEISSEHIAATITKEAGKLVTLYRYLDSGGLSV